MQGDSVELAQFREQWKQEVRARLQGLQPDEAHDPPSPTEKHSTTSRTPVEIYRSAVVAEEDGRLDEALALYRQAFRRAPNVDKAFHQEELALAVRNIKLQEKTVHKVPENKADFSNKRLQHTHLHLSAAHLPLSAVLSEFPPDLVFIAEEDNTVSPLQTLPLEILVEILLKLAHHHDVTTIERFARVSRKARAITLDPVIWRYMVHKTYVPPQIRSRDLLDGISVSYKADYRRIYKEHPRLRLDGVYIAICHYVRAGLSENAWLSISHLVTYHRYLRFLPDGVVLSLLANEDINPREIVHMLTPGHHVKGMMQGSWDLDGTTVRVTDLLDPSKPVSKYSFQMILNLKSRPLGRWNKLDLETYDSVEISSGEAIPFALKHERPFWFSKVKSYISRDSQLF